MTFDPYIQSGIKLNYAFNGRIMISPVKEVNGVRSCFTCRVAKHAIYRKKMLARAFSRRFAIVQWKKPIFPVTRENKNKKKKKKKRREGKMLYTNVLFHKIGQTDVS